MTIPLSGFFNSRRLFTKAWERNAQQSHTKDPCAVSSKNARQSRKGMRTFICVFMHIRLTCLAYSEGGHGLDERDPMVLTVLDKLVLMA